VIAEAGGGVALMSMEYRVTGSSLRRVPYLLIPVVAVVLLVQVSIYDPNGHTVTSLTAFSLLGAWIAVIGVRGWRSATLLASARKVTVRTLAWTFSWRWEQIEGFTAETRPVAWRYLPMIRSRRQVLGIRLREGRVSWLSELTCRPAADGQSWVDISAARLNELRQMHRPPPGGS
jgi:hypothetical protein